PRRTFAGNPGKHPNGSQTSHREVSAGPGPGPRRPRLSQSKRPSAPIEWRPRLSTQPSVLSPPHVGSSMGRTYAPGGEPSNSVPQAKPASSGHGQGGITKPPGFLGAAQSVPPCHDARRESRPGERGRNHVPPAGLRANLLTPTARTGKPPAPR